LLLIRLDSRRARRGRQKPVVSSIPRCGLAVIELASGNMTHWVRIEGLVRELYDVAVLPGTRRPSAIGFKTNEVKRVITIDEGEAG
jgi:hypothetical protein